MLKRFILPVFLAGSIILTGCVTRAFMEQPTATPTEAAPSQTAPPTASPIPPTETPTAVPLTPTTPPAENPILHFPAGQEFTVTSIDMIDEQTGWALGGLLGASDHVLRTTDGGTTWTDLTPPEETPASGEAKTATAFFQDGESAWVLYSDVTGTTPPQPFVWRTNDAGTTWQAGLPLDVSELNEFYNPSDLHFVEGKYGWLMVHVGVGMNHDYIVLYRSTDGGQTWERLVDPYTDMSGIMACIKTGMVFTDAAKGWLTGDCNGVAAGVMLFKSMDGGETWERIDLPDPTGAEGLFSNMMAACGAYDPYFFSAEQGLMAVNCLYYEDDPPTYQYYIFSTNDGGSTWTSYVYPGLSLYFISPNTGWALSRNIERSSDGGKTWSLITPVNWEVKVDFVTEQIGWGVAQRDNQIALVKTTSGGELWSMLVPMTGP